MKYAFTSWVDRLRSQSEERAGRSRWAGLGESLLSSKATAGLVASFKAQSHLIKYGPFQHLLRYTVLILVKVS